MGGVLPGVVGRKVPTWLKPSRLDQKSCDSSMSRTLRTRWLMPSGAWADVGLVLLFMIFSCRRRWILPGGAMEVAVRSSGRGRRCTCERLQPGNGLADGMVITAGTSEETGVWSLRKQRVAMMDGD